MTIIEQTSAYLDQLLHNASVQDDIDRSLSRARLAARRAKQQKSAKAAVMDAGVRARVQQSYRAARSAALQVKRGPEIEQRRRRRTPLLVAGAVLSAAVVAALYGDLRDQLSPQPSQGA